MKNLFDDRVFQDFAIERPIATMSQLALRRLLDAGALEQLFKDNAEFQYHRTLLFSTLTHLMSSVVLGKFASINAGYKKMKQALGVSLYAVYQKLNRVELQTSQALVRHSYQQAFLVRQGIGGIARHDLAGYTTRILDGNHLSKTEHRLKETREITAAAGQVTGGLRPPPRCDRRFLSHRRRPRPGAFSA